jgi:hypothetical protein
MNDPLFQFSAHGDAAHTLFDPGFGVTLGPVQLTGAGEAEFGIFDFLYPFIADFGQPAFEGFRFGGRDRLNDAEDALGVVAVQLLPTARCLY